MPGMDQHEKAFRAAFRQTLSSARRLVRGSLPRTASGLPQLMEFALRHHTPSGYPFVLKYAFCRRERDGARILNIAAAVHLLQQSSFLTDDIFDRGELRYGILPVYLQYDVNRAIIAAELLQGIALRCVGEELARGGLRNGAAVFQLLNQILVEGYAGQYLDLFHSARPSVTVREYYRMIALGAGRAFQNVARCGALLAGKPEREVRSLGRFGYGYGMALFIIDDIVDLLPAARTGKTFAGDLKGRRMHLPLLLALRLGNRTQKQMLHRFLAKSAARRPRVEQVVAVIHETGALEASQRIARRYLHEALRSLKKLPQGVTADRLRWLAGRLLPLV